MFADNRGCHWQQRRSQLRAPPPLGRPLEFIRTDDCTAQLRDGSKLLATARRARLELADYPAVSVAEAEDSARRSPYMKATTLSHPALSVARRVLPVTAFESSSVRCTRLLA